MNNGEIRASELLSAYHDGEVTAAEREAVETLLAESAEARAELEDYQRISADLRDWIADAPTVDVSADVLARIRQPAAMPGQQRHSAAKASRSWRVMLPWGIAGLLAASVLIVIGVRWSQDIEPLGMPVAGDAQEAARVAPPRAAADRAGETMATAPPSAESAGSMPELSAAPMPMARGKIFLSGENARPPAGVGVGDVYSYLERTEAGDIVVVQAYVIDIRRAVDQLQVLLARNEIPTAAISSIDEGGLNLGIAAARSRNDLAVYVESDPERVRVALADLRRQMGMPSNSIQELQIAGVLDSPESRRGLELSSPPAEAPRPEAAAMLDSGFEPNTDKAMRPAEASSTDKPEAGQQPAEASQSDFQTVLNVSNSAISAQLRRQQAEAPVAPEQAASKRGEAAMPFAVKPPPRKSSDVAPPESGRRLRLLLVLQRRPWRPAVEAPRP